MEHSPRAARRAHGNADGCGGACRPPVSLSRRFRRLHSSGHESNVPIAVVHVLKGCARHLRAWASPLKARAHHLKARAHHLKARARPLQSWVRHLRAWAHQRGARLHRPSSSSSTALQRVDFDRNTQQLRKIMLAFQFPDVLYMDRYLAKNAHTTMQKYAQGPARPGRSRCDRANRSTVGQRTVSLPQEQRLCAAVCGHASEVRPLLWAMVRPPPPPKRAVLKNPHFSFG